MSEAAKGLGLGKRRPFLSSTLASVLALVVIVPVFLVSSFTVSRELNAAYDLQSTIYITETNVARLGQLQTDEATNVRAYVETGERSFRDRYDLLAVPLPDRQPATDREPDHARTDRFG